MASAYIKLASKLSGQVQSWLENFGSTIFGASDKIPAESASQPIRRNFVWGLLEESLQYRKKQFALRTPSQVSGENEADPLEFWRNCRRLENGKHWDVWGHRYAQPGDEWMAEMVDDEASNQARVKKATLLGQWHRLRVTPNIKNIDQILYWERIKTKFQETLNRAVTQGNTEGTGLVKSIINTSISTLPYIDEVLCDNESILLTPFARSIDKKDGCWYLIHCYYMPRREAASVYRMKETDIVQYGDDFWRKVYPLGDQPERAEIMKQWNRDAAVIDLYLDDDTVEDIPFERVETDDEHALFHQGQQDDPDMMENHVKHVKEHLAYLEEVEASMQGRTDLTEQDIAAYTQFATLLEEHILLHFEKSDLYVKLFDVDPGTRKKYPAGRHIVWVAGHVALDEPNDNGVGWRELFHKYVPEMKAKEFHGRGIMEILWNTNRNLDTMLSRIADVALLHGNPKPYFSIEDKELHADPETALNNDPKTPGYFNTTPPTFRQATASPDNYQIYGLMKANAEKQGAVDKTSYGQSPTKQASAELAKTLMAQNQIVSTGEANQNLNAFVQSIMTTRLMMMRRHYVVPRAYVINGMVSIVNVSELLTYADAVGPDGSVQRIEIPDFMVEIQEGSNLANQWESDLNMLYQMASAPLADGMPLIPREAVLDHLAERYPEFAVDGRYYQMSQATQIGLQVMAEQQKKAEQEKAAADKIESNLVSKGISQVTS